MTLSTEYIVSSLQEFYGETVTTGDIRAWCTMNETTYNTVIKRLDEYKIGRGRWNLTVQEKLEHTYNIPPVLPVVEQNLIPVKDDTFVKFGNFTDIKKLLSPIYSIQRLSRVFLVMVKRSLLNRPVPNLDENSFV